MKNHTPYSTGERFLATKLLKTSPVKSERTLDANISNPVYLSLIAKDIAHFF